MTDLRPGQQRIMKLFSGSNHDVVFIPHDVFDLRICNALVERGMLSPFEHEEGSGYELTDAGRQALAEEQSDG
ncbi:hypothetical protein [Caulobacter hibisci]|uniref:Uncharacterized protein n=1 Tax=Caulobacter hibisci TaxID=2035993 RepID=A0ABS0SSK5_9CAUL|nr:hypothetical protein [Caulobacter hibisci]MBI1682326.1 hypothetical protein [Caulobacter hibisci]